MKFPQNLHIANRGIIVGEHDGVVANLARKSVMTLLLISLLTATLVAVPHRASAVENHGIATEGGGVDETQDFLDVPEVPSSDPQLGELSFEAPPIDGANSQPEPVALEDLLFEDDALAGDELLRPALSDGAPRTVSVGTAVQGWPEGTQYGSSPTATLEVYAPTDDHLTMPWHQLTTRLKMGGTMIGPEVIVPSALQINRSPATANARVTNALYARNTVYNPTNRGDFLTLASFPEVSGTAATQFLSTNFSMRDVVNAGAQGVSNRHYFFDLHVIPSAAGGAINAADRTQGRWFQITFTRDHDPANPPPSVMNHPADVTVTEGEVAWFSGAASNATSQQWQVSTDAGSTWGDVAGAAGASLEVGPATSEMDGWLYRVVFSNASGSVQSNPARLTVVPLAADPVILTHPEDAGVGAPRAAVFSASAESESEMTVRWQWAANAESAARDEWVDIEGATGEMYEITATTLEMHGTLYRAVFTNASGSVATNSATLSVWVAPGAKLSVTPRATQVESLSNLS